MSIEPGLDYVDFVVVDGIENQVLNWPLVLDMYVRLIVPFAIVGALTLAAVYATSFRRKRD